MRIGLGCVTLGSASGELGWGASVRLVREAIDSGVAVFDTADAYGNGSSERVLGRALGRHRDEVLLATKGGYVFRNRGRVEQTGRRLAHRAIRRVRSAQRERTDGPSHATSAAYTAQDFSPQHLRHALDASLRRLRTDRVDVYQLHGPPALLPEVIPVVEDLVAAGKVRRFGIGAETLGSAAEWLASRSTDRSASAVDVLQVPFGPLDPQAADELFPAAAQQHVEIWARGAFGGGLLAAAERGAAASDPKLPMIRALHDIAAESGIDVFELAVGFVAAHREVGTLILGMSSPDHLRRNLAIARSVPTIRPDVVSRIRQVVIGSGTDNGASNG